MSLIYQIIPFSLINYMILNKYSLRKHFHNNELSIYKLYQFIQFLLIMIPHYYQLNQNEQNNKQPKSSKFTFPVDLKKCQKHRKANLICKVIDQDIKQLKKKMFCQCCGRIQGKQPYKTCFIDYSIFAKYGPGIPLYFQFFKSVMFLVLIYFFLFGIESIALNYLQLLVLSQSHDCSKYMHCWSNNLSMRISFLNAYQQGKFLFYQAVLILVLMLIAIFYLLFIRYKLKHQKKKFDDLTTSPSDFAMILRRLPEETQQSDIEFMINDYKRFLNPVQRAETNNLKIHKIIFAYDLDQYLQIEQKNTTNFKKCCQSGTQFIEIQLPQINRKLSTAVVIFQKQKSKNLFTGHISFIQGLKKHLWLGYQPLSQLIKVKNQYVNVQRAPQPDDIIWENQGIHIKELLTKRITIFILSLNLLMISALIQFFLSIFRRRVYYNDQKSQRWFSIASAGLITLINLLIQFVLIYSSKVQLPSSHTFLKISMTYKLVMMQFINSGLISIMIASSIYTSFKFYKTFICDDMLYIMIMNAITNNIINFLFVYFQIPNSIYRLQFKTKMRIFTQMEANKIYQANQVDIQYKYAYIFKTLWLTVFFMPAQPVVILVSLIGLIINYWSQKYLFSGFYSIPHMFSGKISIAVLDLLNYTFLWMTLGSFYIHCLRFNFVFRQIPIQYLSFHIVGLIISIFVICAPLSSIAESLFGDKKNQYSIHKSYEIQQQNFQITYETQNIAYNKKGPKFLEFQKLGLLLINNIENNQNKGQNIQNKIFQQFKF